MKKVGLIFLVFLLAFSPVTVLAETVEDEENTESVDENVAEEQESLELESEADDSVSEANENEEEEKKTSESGEESDVEPVPAEDEEPTGNEAEEGTDEQPESSETTEADEQVQNESPESEEESVKEEEIKATTNTLSLDDGDNCPLGKNTEGSISGNAALNDAGYYELTLSATVYNCYNTVDDRGHIGFDLPDGIELIDELAPEGVEVRDRDGRVFVKYPDIEPDGEVTTTVNIPVIGEATGEEVVTYSGRYRYAGGSYAWTDNFAETMIDFSEVTEVNEIPEVPEDPEDQPLSESVDALSGTVSGGVTGFDSENGIYNLELNVEITNDADLPIVGETGIYTGFVIPEGLQVLYNDQNVIGLDTDNNYEDIEEILIHVPLEETIAPGETVNRTVTVPVLGLVSENITESPLALYREGGLGYEHLGQLAGNASVDFSVMNEAWSFDAESQIVRDFPGLEDGQLGLQFAFSVQNLTLENADQVSIEFIIPDAIDVHEPDSYSTGDIPDALEDFLNLGEGFSEELDIDWNGNTATINLDIIEGTSGYQGFFSAFGESTASIEQLEGLQVVVTLYQNGNEVAQELMVPFEIVSYEGNDEELSGDSGDNGNNKEGSNGKDRAGQAPERETDDGSGTDGAGQASERETDGGSETEGEETPSEGGDQNNEQGDADANYNESDDRHINIADKTDSTDNDSNEENAVTANDSDGSALPDTTTNMYNILLIGLLLLLTGATILFIRKYRTA